ncbi:BNR-repeat neuraminidase N-terminal domain-containing protein [Hymenobacter armeniacus]|uniref:Secretion system C-terminal sorting domain-containing protein n=1 Tax=Hymenobacter armeniacus TaxID=2771358 RepID=A0ABR8JYG7_9BACT|nr:BNR-repeat neuraminidase N-terminal domain-containing protein [Hymenobacter armeniacus]MBD2722814.1 hypothetical protein [Hymenobacter armeniacus]
MWQLLGLLTVGAAPAWAQPSVIGTNTGDVSNSAYGTYVAANLVDVGGFRQYRTQAANSTTDNVAEWQFAQGTASNVDYNNKWLPYANAGIKYRIPGFNQAIAPNTAYPPSTNNGTATYSANSGVPGGLPALTAGRYYTFNITKNAPTADNTMAVLETAYNPVAISAVAANTATPGKNSLVQITATLASAPNAAEYFYVRYSTNAFGTSALVPLTVSGTTATGLIPGQAAGTAVSYYVLSSPIATAAAIGTDYDMLTLNLNNNGGANYNYTVAATVCGIYGIDNATGNATGSAGVFNSFTNAFAFLNASTLSCATTFNVTAGSTYTEKAALGTIAGSSAANIVTFQKSGTGANPKITAPGGSTSTTVDAIIGLNGTDYVTFDGIDLLDPSTNTTAATQMEAGYALWRAGTGATLNGCQNVTIKNSTVTLQKPLAASSITTGILSANTDNAGATAVVTGATVATAINTNNTFTANTLTNMSRGVVLQGLSSATYYDQNNTVGGAAIAAGNTINNINVGSSTSGEVYGILADYQTGTSITFNTVDNAGNGGTANTRELRCIAFNLGTSGVLTASNNTLTTQTSQTAVVYGIRCEATGLTLTTSNNQFTAVAATAGSSGAIYFMGILVSSSTGNLASWTADGNTWDNAGKSLISSGQLAFAYNSNKTPTVTFTNNTAKNIARTTNAGTFYGYYNGAGGPATTPALHTITGNVIQGLSFPGSSDVYGIQNTAGTTSSRAQVKIEGNTIKDITSVTGAIYGVLFDYGDNAGGATTSTINANTINKLSSGPASSLTKGVYGIFVGGTTSFSSGTNVTNLKVQSNQIGEVGDAATPTLNGINNSGATPVAGIYFNGGATSPSLDFSSNVIKNVNSTNSSSSPSAYGMFFAAPGSGNATITASGNTIAGVSLTNSANSGSAYGMLVTGVGTSGTATVEDNVINNVLAQNTSSSVYGIRFSAAATANVRRNTLYALSHTNTFTGVVYGLYFGGGNTFNISRNKVYDLSSAAATATVYGIYTLGGSADNVDNNLIGDLRAPISTATGSLVGINLTNSGPYNVYHNTVRLNATSTSATTFGSSAVLLGSGMLDLRNNLLVNLSTPVGAAYTSALRRNVAATSANTAATTNNNILYAGTPGTNNVVYAEGSTPTTYPALADYRNAMAALGGSAPLRESAAGTENPPFLSTTGSAATFLHIDPAVATLVESGGTPVSGVTTDFDGDARNATTPDVGADEGNFTPAPTMAVTALTYAQNGLNTTNNATNQLITSLTVTTAGNYDRLRLTSVTFSLAGTAVPTNDITNAKLYTSTSATFAAGTATLLGTAGSLAAPNFTFTLSTPQPLTEGANYYFLTYDITGGATVGRTIAAVPTNVAFTSSVTNTASAITSGSSPVAIALTGTAATRTIVGPLNGTYTVGIAAGNDYATITAALADLAFRGVSGPVIFSLTNATATPYNAANGETFPFVIPPFGGASATNTVTLKPAPGVAPVVSGNSGSTNTAVFKLDGVDYFAFDGSNTPGGSTRDLTISNTTNQVLTAVVWVASAGTGAGATNIIIKNTNLVGTSSSTGLFGVFAGSNTIVSNGGTGTGADNDNLTIQNNSFQTLAYGIYAGGTAGGTTAGSLDGLVISDNAVGTPSAGLTTVGIQISNTGGNSSATGAQITRNTVQNVVGSSATPLFGIYADTGVPFVTISQNTIDGISQGFGADASGIYAGAGFTDGTIARNRVVNIAATATGSFGAHGIDARTGSNTSNLLIANNTVAGINGSCGTTLSTNGISGIRLLSSMGGAKVYYNSVNLTGATTNTTASTVSAAFHTSSLITTAGTLDVRNNVFANSLVSPGSSGARNYAIYSGAPRTAYATIDYNDYYVNGPNGVLGNYAGTGAATSGSDLTTLAAIQNATSGLGQNGNSRNAVPGFVSATDLHLSNFSALESAGVSLAGTVDTDYDGDARQGSAGYTGTGTAPDLGSDEAAVLPATALALSGTYTIDNTQATSYPTGRNFRSFSDAVAVLNQSTIATATAGTPAVTFNVSAGQTFAEEVPAISTTATGATTAVTFQKAGAGANPVLQPAGSALNALDAGFTVQGADYLTFDGIDVNAPGGNVEFGYLVRNASATNGAFNNTVQNATISLNRNNLASWGVTQTTDLRYGGATTPTSLAGCNQNNRYLGLQVYNAVAGIVALGYSSTLYDYNTEIANCVVGSSSAPIGGGAAFSVGINGLVNRKMSVHDNSVQYVSSTLATAGSNAASGIYVGEVVGGAATTTPTDASSFYNNRISNISSVGAANAAFVRGIYLGGSTTSGAGYVAYGVNAYNNAVTGLTSGYTGTATGNRYVQGIFLTTGAGGTSFSVFNISFNTVSLNTGTPTYSSTCYEFSSASGATLNTRNNIFANLTGAQSGAALHYAYNSTSASSIGVSGSVSDYNDLWVANTTNGILLQGGNNATGTRTDLAGAQANGEGVNSKSIDPVFDAILRPTNSALNGLGLTISGIATDLVGTVRATGTAASQTGPDMGAYEFPNTTNVALNAAALTAPAANYCTPGPLSAPITLSVTNTSTNALVLGVNQKLLVSGTLVLPGGGTQPLSVTVTSGTIPANGSLPVSVGTANLTAAGTYTFQALTVALQTSEGLTIPETLTTDNTLSPNPTVTVGDQTTYTGNAPGDGSNWFNAANWTACVPSNTIDALIPAGLANYPNLNTAATAAVRTLTIANGASLSQSAGTLNVYGNLTSSTPAANVSLTGGMVAFRGAAPTVTGIDGFYDLNVNLTAAAGVLALANNTSVAHALTMSQGVLNTGTYTVTLAPAATLSETDASYVLGQVAVPGRDLSTATAESFGNIGLTLTPDAASTAFPGLTTVVRTTGTVLTGAGTSQSIKRYFDIQPATNTGLNVAMDFSYFDHERNGIAPGNVALFKSVSGPAGPWANQAPITIAGNTVSKIGIADFSIWTLGSATNPLPVELTAFTAERQGNNAILAWTTASEKNNAGFDVQVSLDGRAFRTLGFVASPSASSSAPRHYTFLDAEKGKAGLRYYRLRQLDVTGKAEFSPVRTVRFESEAAPALLLTGVPNPFAHGLTLRVELPVGTPAAAAQLRVTDAAGRLVLATATPVLAAGLSQLPLDLRGQASGVYFVQLAFPGQPAQHLRVVKE